MLWLLTSSRKPSRKSLVVVLLVKKPQMALCSTLVLRRRLVDGNARRARRTKRGSFPDTAFSICFTCSLMSEEDQKRRTRSGELMKIRGEGGEDEHQIRWGWRSEEVWPNKRQEEEKQTTEKQKWDNSSFRISYRSSLIILHILAPVYLMYSQWNS